MSRYLRGASTDEETEKVAVHIAACARCRHVLDAATQAVDLRIGTQNVQAALSRAKSFVAALESLPSTHAMQRAIISSPLRSDRFVAGRLLERSREEFSRDPRLSMRFAHAALTVAERANSCELKFEVWRDFASLSVRLGDFRGAWHALKKAEALVPETLEPEHSRGLILYAKAYVGSQPDEWRLDEALASTNEAEVIFQRADAARLRATGEMRAFIHHLRGEHDAAVAICRGLWDEHADVGLALNFASYLTDAGRPSDAEELLTWAHRRIPPTDIVTLAKHADIEGIRLCALETYEAAASAFARSVTLFRQAAMEDAALRVDLSRVRAGLASAPDSAVAAAHALHDLQALAAASIALERRQPTTRRRLAAEAMRFLRDLTETEGISIMPLRRVEDYLREITRGPARPFFRPMSTRLM